MVRGSLSTVRMEKRDAKQRRHWIIRKRVKGSKDKPRLVVFRSLKHTYAQLVDDTIPEGGFTIVAATTKELEQASDLKKTEQSFKAGQLLGKKALEKGIDKVCFDRAGYRYHGRVKAVAEGARKAGLIF